MRQSRRNAREGAQIKALRRRRTDAPVAEVPTFQPDPNTPAPPKAQSAAPEDAVERAVRRMVEAAYT
jgi:hypothetical protein